MATKAISQAKNWKAKLVKDLDADLKKKHRATLKKLRESMAGVRKAARGKLARLRATCPARAKVRVAKIREKYRAARAVLRDRFRALRAKLAAQCRACQHRIRAGVLKRLEPLAAQVTHEKALLSPLRELDRLARAAARRGGRRGAVERHQEDNDAVESNVEAEDPVLVPVWRRVASSIKGRPGMSRTEEFFHFVHEHPEDVLAMRVEIAEHELERELAEMEEKAHRDAPAASERRPVRGHSKGGPRKTGGKRRDDEESAEDFFERLAQGARAA